MLKKKLISVIMPVYNIGASSYIAQAFQSIYSQDYKNLEIVVVDDGSSDDSEKIIKQLSGPINYIRQKHQGVSSARNKGLENARGEIIAFLDSDDLWPEDKLKKQSLELNSSKSRDVILGLTQICMKDKANKTKDKASCSEVGSPYLSYNLGSALFKKSVFEKAGKFNSSLSFAEDYDWFMRARESKVSIVVIREISLFYRLHDKNMSGDKKQIEDGVMESFLSSIHRRKSKGRHSLKTLVFKKPR
ncbi:MAG: glycosyltransferase [Candidatus Omnitrophica bacterium]|nr:glycosyltransferase [Candidatus Omnitrophota bacterium]